LNGKLIYLNDEVVYNQRSVVKYLIKKVGSNLLKGNSVMNISWPVSVFNKQTFLMRHAQTCQIIPKYIK